MNFIESNEALLAQQDRLVIHRTQDIPQSYMDELREEAGTRRLRPGQNVNRVASVPEVIVNKWFRAGFDIYHETNKAIVARLKAEGLDYFVTGRV